MTGRRKIPRIVVALGTRPEAIKLLSVIQALRRTHFSVKVVSTGQHRELLHETLNDLGITVDVDLSVMRQDQKLHELCGAVVREFGSVLAQLDPNCVIVQGDTTTALACGLASAYARIPVAHVEAGMRTYDHTNPFPEEINRVVLAQLTRWHFAPNVKARDALIGEGICSTNIHIVGNTGLDTLFSVARRGVWEGEPGRKVVLLTIHRRESFGRPLDELLEAVRVVAETRDDAVIVFPTHPNPRVRSVAEYALGSIKNVLLISPPVYSTFVSMLKRAHVVLTDSGGVQVEAEALGRSVITLRDKTEWTSPTTICTRSKRKLINLINDALDAELQNVTTMRRGSGAGVTIANVLQHELNHIVEVTT